MTAAPVRTTVSRRDLIDDGHDALEPRRHAVGVEQLANDQIDGRLRRDVRALEEGRDPIVDDVLDVAGADAGLLHGGRVDVHLDGRVAAGAEVALEAGRNHDDEHEPAPVHLVLDLDRSDQLGKLETRRIEGVEQLLGQRRPVLVDEGDRGVVHLARGPRRLDVDGQGERVDDEHDHHHVAHQAANLLEPEPEDVQQRRLHRYFSCFFKPRTLTPGGPGCSRPGTTTSLIMRPAPSPLV